MSPETLERPLATSAGIWETEENAVDLRVGTAPSDAPLDDVSAGCGPQCCIILSHAPEAIGPGYEVEVID